MGITINNIPRERSRQTNSNPFKSAKPFDDNIDYNSLEDGDLFYIEQKEGWEECSYEKAILTIADPLIKDEIKKFTYDNGKFDAASCLLSPPGTGYGMWNFDLRESDLIKFSVCDESTYGPGLVGVFFKPSSCCQENVTIPTHLSKQDFNYWSQQLPTIVLGSCTMYQNENNAWVYLLNEVVTRPCLLGNKILSYDLQPITQNEGIPHITIDELDSGNCSMVVQMMPIFCLKNNSNGNSHLPFSVDRNPIDAAVAYYEDYFEIWTPYCILYSHSYQEDVRNLFMNIYENMPLNKVYASKCYYDIIQQYLQNSEFYCYTRPNKLYIIYNKGMFTNINDNRSIITAKSYLKILEYFEEHPDDSMIFSTYECLQLFNVKPMPGHVFVVSPHYIDAYSSLNLDQVMTIKFIDKDLCQISLSGNYQNSSSSQELQIGEFEE